MPPNLLKRNTNFRYEKAGAKSYVSLCEYDAKNWKTDQSNLSGCCSINIKLHGHHPEIFALIQLLIVLGQL